MTGISRLTAVRFPALGAGQGGAMIESSRGIDLGPPHDRRVRRTTALPPFSSPCCALSWCRRGTSVVECRRSPTPRSWWRAGWRSSAPKSVVAVAPFALVGGEDWRIAGVGIREDPRRHVRPCIPWINRSGPV
jgi:hypothetical protein